jgi:phytanoyl-CoA hydroxylase
MHSPLFNFSSGGFSIALMQQSYHHYGFLILENFIPQATLELLRERAYSLAFEVQSGLQPVIHPQHKTQWREEDLEATTRSYCCYWEESFKDTSSPRLLKISHALHRLEPSLQSFIQSSAIIQLAHSLALTQAKIVQSMLHFKPPHSSSAVDWHQDATYIATMPYSTMGLWLALEDATPDNGCLRVIPTAHRQGLCSQMIRSSSGELSLHTLQERKWLMKKAVNLPVRAGSLIVLHGLLPHSSGDNSSKHSRLSLTLHLVDLKSKYSEKNWLPLKFI